jgi:hypothetical protein
VPVDNHNSDLPETEYAKRISTESDSHTYYCAECRATYDFPWARAQDCTCERIQDFIVQHREGHAADTKRPQIYTSVTDPLYAGMYD